MILVKNKLGSLCSVVLLFTISQSINPGHAAQPGGEEPYAPRIGYTANTFVEVNVNDAQAIASRLTDFIVSKRGAIAETRIYSSLNKVESDLNSKKLDLIVMVASEFLVFNGRNTLDPLFTSARENDVYEQLVLLIRKDSGIKNIRDLKGKLFINHRGQFADLKNIWLETLVVKEGGRDIRKYFRFSKEVMKPSQAVLVVYFRQADFCVVTRNNFEVASELNPQLRRELAVLAETRPFAGGIIAVRKDYNPRHREIIQYDLERLHQDVQGQQLLTIFHKNRLVPFRTEYLTSLESILKEHIELKARTAKR